jgi:hypothetical protein
LELKSVLERLKNAIKKVFLGCKPDLVLINTLEFGFRYSKIENLWLF